MDGSSLLSSETAQGVLTKDSACPSLPVKYRFWGFVSCFCLGVLLIVIAMFLFVANTSALKFGLLLTFGNIFALASTFFLIGPMRQAKLMFKKTRIFATILCLFCILFTFIFSLWIYNESTLHKVVMWILIILQFASLFWYVLSYIPFARTICKKICGCLCTCDE